MNGQALAMVSELFKQRNRNGGTFNFNEDIVNAMQRNLSTFKDEDLMLVIKGCNDLKQLAAEEYDARKED